MLQALPLLPTVEFLVLAILLLEEEEMLTVAALSTALLRVEAVAEEFTVAIIPVWGLLDKETTEELGATMVVPLM
jgi:hypothetical protein